jgi:hypothetical protein
VSEHFVLATFGGFLSLLKRMQRNERKMPRNASLLHFTSGADTNCPYDRGKSFPCLILPWTYKSSGFPNCARYSMLSKDSDVRPFRCDDNHWAKLPVYENVNSNSRKGTKPKPYNWFLMKQNSPCAFFPGEAVKLAGSGASRTKEWSSYANDVFRWGCILAC